MNTFALVEKKTGKIVNRIACDDLKAWQAPEGYLAVPEDGTPVEVGGAILNGKYVAPARAAVVSQERIVSPEDKLASLGLTKDELRQLLGIK